jgi:hypothetical protein
MIEQFNTCDKTAVFEQEELESDIIKSCENYTIGWKII